MSNRDVLISYVLVGFNSGRYIVPCLDSILADSPVGAEIIFVDNASSDGSREVIESRYPNVRLLKNAENLGHCKAVNQGLRIASGRYIMVLDVDTELERGTTETMLAFLKSHPDAACAAPRMLNEDGSIQETARSFPSPINALFGRQTLLARWFPNNPITLAYLGRKNINRQVPFDVDWVSAACMVFPAATIALAGLWDEGYEGYWVDCDWCKRIQSHGGKIYCVPQAKVRHYEQNRPKRSRSAARLRMFNRGVHRFYTVHYTWGRFDPRSLFAGAALWLRTQFQCVMGYFSRSLSNDPMSQSRQNVSGQPAGISAKE